MAVVVAVGNKQRTGLAMAAWPVAYTELSGCCVGSMQRSQSSPGTAEWMAHNLLHAGQAIYPMQSFDCSLSTFSVANVPPLSRNQSINQSPLNPTVPSRQPIADTTAQPTPCDQQQHNSFPRTLHKLHFFPRVPTSRPQPIRPQTSFPSLERAHGGIATSELLL